MNTLSVCLLVSLRQSLDVEDDLQQLQSDGVPSEVTDWLASTFTQKVHQASRRADDKPRFRSIVHAVQAGIFVERFDFYFFVFFFFFFFLQNSFSSIPLT